MYIHIHIHIYIHTFFSFPVKMHYILSEIKVQASLISNKNTDKFSLPKRWPSHFYLKQLQDNLKSHASLSERYYQHLDNKNAFFHFFYYKVIKETLIGQGLGFVVSNVMYTKIENKPCVLSLDCKK